MFAINQNKGFSISFPNGWTVSVQFGPVNYCENYDPETDEQKEKDWEGNWTYLKQFRSKDAEIAAFPTSRKGRWFSFTSWEEEDDYTSQTDVKGNVEPLMVLKFLNHISRLTPIKE
jgi:hypothetical protein